MAIPQTTRLCSLAATAGKSEACPEDACPFWEPGGAVLDGRCPFEQLGPAVDGDTAAWLLEIRAKLTSARTSEDEETARSLFRHLLNESPE